MTASGDIVRSVYEAIAAGDVPAVLAPFDDNIRWVEAENSFCADGNPHIGPDNVVSGVFAPHLEGVEGFAATPHNFVDGEDAVAVEGRYTGTVKATGKPLDAQFAHFWKLKDGKVVGFQQYTDTKQWADVLDE